MGDVADMMLDGTLCEGCGVYLGSTAGVPMRCRDCKGDTPQMRGVRGAKNQARKAAPIVAQAPGVPKWRYEATDDVVQRFHCVRCGRDFKTDDAARQHVREGHRA